METDEPKPDAADALGLDVDVEQPRGAPAPVVDARAGVVDDDRRKRLRADPDDALARADDDEAADGLTRAHDLEAVAEGASRGAYGYN